VDEPFYRVRVTWVAALLGVLGLWRRADGDERTELDKLLRRFALENAGNLGLWGEAAVPQYLAVYWHHKLNNASSNQADGLLRSATSGLCEAKRLGSQQVLPDVYVEAKDWLPYLVDQQLEDLLPEHTFRLAKEALDTNYQGYSHTFEGLVHLLVQQGWKLEVRLLWPTLTKIGLSTFEFDEPWHFYRWRNAEGREKTVMPEHTKDWDDLKLEATEASGERLPALIRERPVFALLFSVVYPHWANAALLRWINGALKHEVYEDRAVAG
jgi:hypothetical protein